MTNRLPIQRCQYCGCEDIGLGWQHGEALVTFKKHGMLSAAAAVQCSTSTWRSLTSILL